MPRITLTARREIDARVARDAGLLAQLLQLAQAGNVKVLVKRLETAGTLELLERVCRAAGAFVCTSSTYRGALNRHYLRRRW